jgi:hypothetical protein
MTFTERLDNYAKRSLAHQLTFRVACDPTIRDVVGEVYYERTDTLSSTGTTPVQDAGVIIFNTGMTIRLYDVHHPHHGYGIGTKDFHPNNTAHNTSQRNYYRNAHRELSDAQWRNHVTTTIASDYDHLHALALRGEKAVAT